MRELHEFAKDSPFDDRPWLLLGKGPTFARRGDFDLSDYQVLTLNHAVLEAEADIAHIIDVDVVHDCEAVLVDRCRFVVMPRVPHVGGRVGFARLEDYFRASPALRQLEDEGRLIWYNAETGPSIGGAPKVEVRFFGSEAALGVCAALGAATVRSLGVDGGTAYASAFGGLESLTRLSNGQPSFDQQFAELRRISRRHGLDYRPLIEPVRVFVGASRAESVPYRVLAHSIHERASVPVRVESLDQVTSPMPKTRENRPRTAFSFARFHIPELCDFSGRAIYLDSDMVVLGDIAELDDYDIDGAVACTRQETPSAWLSNEWFKPGRQFSVMLLDCGRLDWRISEIVDRLDAGDLDYQSLLFDLTIVDSEEIDDGLDPRWNSLEQLEADTRLVHYTVVPTQPWKDATNPLGHLWFDEYRRAVAAGAVPRAEVEALVASGQGRAELLDVFDELPFKASTPARNVAEVALRATIEELDRLQARSVRWAVRRQVARANPLLRRVRAKAPSSRALRFLERSADRAKRTLR